MDIVTSCIIDDLAASHLLTGYAPMRCCFTGDQGPATYGSSVLRSLFRQPISL